MLLSGLRRQVGLPTAVHSVTSCFTQLASRVKVYPTVRTTDRCCMIILKTKLALLSEDVIAHCGYMACCSAQLALRVHRGETRLSQIHISNARLLGGGRSIKIRVRFMVLSDVHKVLVRIGRLCHRFSTCRGAKYHLKTVKLRMQIFHLRRDSPIVGN